MYAMRATRQLSSCGYVDRRLCLSIKEQQRPKPTPRAMLKVKTKRKRPIPWKSVAMLMALPRKVDRTSNMTMETASLRRDSPKMMLYSSGSTLYVLKMARIVTGSVALSVEPKMRHSSSVSESDSRWRSDQR